MACTSIASSRTEHSGLPSPPPRQDFIDWFSLDSAWVQAATCYRTTVPAHVAIARKLRSSTKRSVLNGESGRYHFLIRKSWLTAYAYVHVESARNHFSANATNRQCGY